MSHLKGIKFTRPKLPWKGIATAYEVLEILEKRKGVMNMPELPKEIEIMRVMNLVQGFGWSKIKEEVIGKKVVLTIEKEIFTDSDLESPLVPD